jgi:hypothetical protein
MNDPRFQPSWTVADFNKRGKSVILNSTNNVGGAVVIETDSWESAGMTAHVATLFLREMIGYEVVIVPRTAHLEGLGETGTVAEEQPTHVQLEMWAAAKKALVEKWTVDKHEVLQVGTVGYSGQVSPSFFLLCFFVCIWPKSLCAPPLSALQVWRIRAQRAC